MAITWDNLRAWNGSVAAAFEELCCQLAASEVTPSGSRFYRKGTPDAGVECYWHLPTLHEWGWQAKWFRSSLNATQWKEIDDSVKHAIAKHPLLTKYVVCLPINLSDARVSGQESSQAKWNKRVAKWESLAAKKGMAVTFEYWGESEIGARLSEERHRGRHWFWFNEVRFGSAWFIQRVDEALQNARDRYSPMLNVDLPIRSHFDSMGRTPAFVEFVKRLYSRARISLDKLYPFSEPGDLQERYEFIASTARGMLSKLESWVTGHSGFFEWSAMRPFQWDEIGCEAHDLSDAAMDAISKIHELREKERKGSVDRQNAGDAYGYRIDRLYEFQHAIEEIAHYSASTECRLSNLPALLLVGEAGQGKTHLLCHVAKTDTLEHRPRVLFHGERFKNDEPWSQMIKHLGLNCTREQLFGALEAAAQAANSRALIFIDALNEGEGNHLWQSVLPGMLTVLAQSPWLGLCISTRNSYENLVVPATLDTTRLVRVRHFGFGDLTYQASSFFFNHFGIQPSTPLMLPEFNNPLFLKLFCQSLHNAGLSRVPDGLHGISAVFKFYIHSIDAKLSRPEWLNYDERLAIVPRAIERLADEMAERKSDYLPLGEAQTIVNLELPRDENDRTLFYHLESEGVLSVVNLSNDEWAESVRFTYQRFSDHLIAQRLLGRYLDKRNPQASFSKRRTLGKLLRDEHECFRHRGLLEAFAIQVPELINQELPIVATHLTKLHSMREAWVEGIVWRDASSFSPETDRYVDEYVLRFDSTFEEFWNALITLAMTPAHPFNADRLHSVLSSFDMADRDKWWSVFLHYQWGAQRAVDRLVEWAWESNDKSVFGDEVIRLAGTAIAWLFTSSNRFLRDRATHALVRLCENRINILRQIIDAFLQVDDPYVTERLFAAAYGCAMRTADYDGLANLAKDVFIPMFESGRPQPHILIRDYARNVIEVALDRCPELSIDLPKIRPPYNSDWPGLIIPDPNDIKHLGAWNESMPDEQWALVHLYHSVMGEEDFSRYVIGDLHRWSAERIGDPPKPTRKQIHDQFVDSLTPSQLEAWDAYSDARRLADSYHLYRLLREKRREKSPGKELTDSELIAHVAEAERRLKSRLREGSKKFKIFEQVKDYKEPHQFDRQDAFDPGVARRWIVQRILDLGWTVQRFGRFDRRISSEGRKANKPERIGKKYQWIAFHELLARLSDNFKLTEDEWSGRKPIYDEPVDAGARRDIDPSSLLRNTKRDDWTASTYTWWFPTKFESWDTPNEEVEWIKRCDDLPDAKTIIEVINPNDGAEWLTLKGSYQWEQPTPPGKDRHEYKRREIWYILRSYLIKKKDSAKLFRWALQQNWMGNWMPETRTSYDIFLGEYFWSRVFKERERDYYGRNGWTRGDGDKTPVDVLVANDEYGRESGGFDCSLDDTILFNLPSRFLADALKLTWRGQEGNWFNSTGDLVAFDPSVRTQGPKALLIKRRLLLDILNELGLTLFWTLLGERRTIGGPFGQRDFQGRLEINGTFVLKTDHLSGAVNSTFEH